MRQSSRTVETGGSLLGIIRNGQPLEAMNRIGFSTK